METPNEKTVRNDSLTSRESKTLTIPYPTKTAEDKWNLVHIMFLLFGIVTIMPATFFVTAHEYWMYKFRDASFDTVDANNRTILQTNFATGQTLASAIPKISFMIIITAIRHKINVGFSMFLSLTIIVCSFALFTGFIGVNTDSWQTTFFAVTMGGLIVIDTASTFFQMNCLIVIAKFPSNYMKTFLFGQGATGTAGSILQIISLFMGTSIQISALFYFMSGTLTIFSTLVLYFINTRLPFYTYYIENGKDDTKKDESHTLKGMLAVLKEVWPLLFINCVGFIGMLLTHTNMTSLVVSEGYGNGNVWNDKYFVPVITFLLSDLSHVSGRLYATDIIRGAAAKWLVLLEVVRVSSFVPLIMFCNVQPRHHLPVLLPHDWQYIIILIVFHSTTGFVISSIYLSVPRLTKQEELGYLLIATASTIVGGIGSFASAVIVNSI